jgi:hypothetical protein
MQIRKIIEHKYSYSHQKSAAIIRKEKRDFLDPFLQNQERHTKISRTHPRLRVYRWNNTYGQEINKKN